MSCIWVDDPPALLPGDGSGHLAGLLDGGGGGGPDVPCVGFYSRACGDIPPPPSGNSSGGASISATPKPTIKPPSWDNFLHEFLPCYAGQLLDAFVGNKGKAGVTAGTIALAKKTPVVGRPLLLIWVGINVPKAGLACAYASRTVYQ